MSKLLCAITLSASLGTASSVTHADQMAIQQFCQTIQHRSEVIQNNSARAENESTIHITSQAPQVSPEYVNTIFERIEKMAKAIHYWDAHCSKDSATTWEMGLVYETVTGLGVSRETLEEQLRKDDSEFYSNLFKYYTRFISGAYGEFPVRSAYLSIDSQMKGKRFFGAGEEVKKVSNHVAQGILTPRNGIKRIYGLFQTEGTKREE